MTTKEILASLKQIGLAVAMFFLFIFGLISAIGSFNWAIRGDGDWLFIAGAIVVMVEVVFASVLFYRRYLKF